MARTSIGGSTAAAATGQEEEEAPLAAAAAAAATRRHLVYKAAPISSDSRFTNHETKKSTTMRLLDNQNISNNSGGSGGFEVLPASKLARQTFNPIRDILENMELRPNKEKEMISLSVGDPTVFGNLRPDPIVLEAVKDSLESGKHNGYVSSVGSAEAR